MSYQMPTPPDQRPAYGTPAHTVHRGFNAYIAIGGLLILIFLIVMLVAGWKTVTEVAGPFIWVVAALACFLVVLALLVFAALLGSMGAGAIKWVWGWFSHHWKLKQAEARRAELENEYRAAQVARERIAAKMVPTDPATGNYAAIYEEEDQRFIQAAPGNRPHAPVPAHYAPSQSLSLSYRNNQENLAGSEEVTVAPEDLPEQCMAIDVLGRREFTPESVFLALGRGGQEIACTLEGFMHVAHDAPTGGGKTSQQRLEIVQLRKMDVSVILANPHFAPVDKKGNDWRPIARALEEQGALEVSPGYYIPGLLYKYEHIMAVLAWLCEYELDLRFARMREGDFSYEPLYMFLDEIPALVSRYKEAAGMLKEVLQRGRAVEVCISMAAQGYLGEDIGLEGSADKNFNTAYHMGGSPHSGAKVLAIPLKAYNDMRREYPVKLGGGIAMLRNGESLPSPEYARLPYADNNFVYHLLGKADDWILPENRGEHVRYDTSNVLEEVGLNVRKWLLPTNSMANKPGLLNAGQKPMREDVIESSAVRPFPSAEREVPDDIRKNILRLAGKGKNRKEIRESLGLTGEKYWMVQKVLGPARGGQEAQEA